MDVVLPITVEEFCTVFEIRLMVFDRKHSERKKKRRFAMFPSCCSVIGDFRRYEREIECKIFRYQAFDRFCSILRTDVKSIIALKRMIIKRSRS